MFSIDYKDLGTPAPVTSRDAYGAHANGAHANGAAAAASVTVEIDGHPITVPDGTSIMRAAATCGLARLMHIPKVAMFSIGAKSMIVAAGMPPTVTVGALVATRLAGAAPMAHIFIAPSTTH